MTEPSWHDSPDHPKRDPRTVGELVSAALGDPSYDHDGWNAVAALHWRGTAEVLERAAELCHSFCAVERRVGADILGQLGIPASFPKPCASILLDTIRHEQDPEVLHSILVAFGHLHDPEAIGPAARFRHHREPEVRDGVVYALMGHDDPLALQVLIELSEDEDTEVRDWATFSLGTQVDVDTPAIRDALAARLLDSDDEARGEALVGLARRGDRRVIPALLKELALDDVGRLAIEAAEIVADPRLYAALANLQDRPDIREEVLEPAVAACAPRAGGALCRRVPH